MANEHPDANKQFGIRLSDEIMEMVSAIQQFRQSNNQSTTLSSIVEDAIEVYYEDMVESGEIQDKL
jgi:predicted DNA-binding protein